MCYCVSAGVLACLDGYMNIAIEQTEEYVNGQLKNKYGDAFLRGNNGKIHFLKDNNIINLLTSWKRLKVVTWLLDVYRAHVIQLIGKMLCTRKQERSQFISNIMLSAGLNTNF